MKDSLYYQVQQLLIQNNIALDKKELEFQIQSHPSYPSLHAITGVLEHFNVDNIALDVPIDEATLTQLPNSFIAQIKTETQKKFVVVINKGLYYEIIYSQKKKNKLSIAEFLDVFTGIIVAVEKTNLIEERKDNSTFINSSLIIVSALILCTQFFLAQPSISIALFFGASILGIFISITLKKQEQGVQTVLGNVFCSGTSEKKDCNAVLTSKGANVLGTYKLSDISLIYFSGLVLAVFILTLLNLNLSLPFAVSLLAFPVTLYSIYYQAIIVKKWCLLCLSVVAILWIQAAFTLINFEIFSTFSWHINNILFTLFGFLSVLTFWNLLAPQLIDLQELKQIKIDHFKFKRNFNLFNALLDKSKTIDTSINDIKGIVFGNPNSNLEVTLVTSPFCGHCKPVHTLVETILNRHPNQVKILIRFNANTNNPDNSLVKITSRLIELYNTEGSTACLKAMHNIYDEQQPEEWLQAFGTCKNTADAFNVLEKEAKWCKENSINFTPAILINGKSYPKEYDRSDLIYFIEDLNEKYTIEEIIKPQLAI